MAFIQSGFRIRTDNTAAQGGTPVWAAAENAVATPVEDVAFRIRFAISNNAATNSGGWQLFVSKNAGAYAQVPNSASTNSVFATDATAGASSNGSLITTSLLTSGVGTFATSGVYNQTGTTATVSVAGSSYVEFEFAIKFQSAFVQNGDTFSFRVYFGSSPLSGGYTQTPTLTIVQAATSARVTQASLEQFIKQDFVPPQAKVTQVSLEEWISVASLPPQAIVTQASLEIWASVRLAVQAQVTQVILEEWAAVAHVQAQVTQVILEEWTKVPNVSAAQITQVILEEWVSAVPSGPSTTGFEVTQAAIEEWVLRNITEPTMDVTQVAIEEWVRRNITEPTMTVTQVAIEEWVSADIPPKVKHRSVWLVGL